MHPSRAAATCLRPGELKTPPDYDAEVLAILGGLPPCEVAIGLFHVGIANQAGRVYRRVDLYSALSVLQFSARLNAAGFAVHPKWRVGGPRTYESVFYKPRRAASRSGGGGGPGENPGTGPRRAAGARQIGKRATGAPAPTPTLPRTGREEYMEDRKVA